MTIFKFELKITDRQLLFLTEGATVISIGNQRGNLCLWVLLDPEATTKPITIAVIETGHPINKDTKMKHLGSAVIEPFVWHVFELLDQ